jgi:hypothetical protein
LVQPFKCTKLLIGNCLYFYFHVWRDTFNLLIYVKCTYHINHVWSHSFLLLISKTQSIENFYFYLHWSMMSFYTILSYFKMQANSGPFTPFKLVFCCCCCWFPLICLSSFSHTWTLEPIFASLKMQNWEYDWDYIKTWKLILGNLAFCNI